LRVAGNVGAANGVRDCDQPHRRGAVNQLAPTPRGAVNHPRVGPRLFTLAPLLKSLCFWKSSFKVPVKRLNTPPNRPNLLTY